MISFEFDNYTEPQMMVTKEHEESSPLVMKTKKSKLKRYLKKRKK
jgi:hypothetical protein